MVDNEKIEHMYSPSNPAIIAVLMAFLLLILVITAVMVARYYSPHHFMFNLYLLTTEKNNLTSTFNSRYFNRHKGEYVTREDEGAADAFDADTAVLQGKTGHHVEKKKEWFI